MNILNSSGPNTDPRGIPRKMSDQLLDGSHFSSLFSAAQMVKKKSCSCQAHMSLILLLLNHAVNSHKL